MALSNTPVLVSTTNLWLGPGGVGVAEISKDKVEDIAPSV